MDLLYLSLFLVQQQNLHHKTYLIMDDNGIASSLLVSKKKTYLDNFHFIFTGRHFRLVVGCRC